MKITGHGDGRLEFGGGANGTDDAAGEWTIYSEQRGNLCSFDSWRAEEGTVTCQLFDALTLLWAYATHVLRFTENERTISGICKGRSKKFRSLTPQVDGRRVPDPLSQQPSLAQVHALFPMFRL